MISISLCMIVKNEEHTLGRCLESVADIVDEIIIVDTGSTDETKKTAEAFTDRIYDFAWIDDFSAARNFAYAKAEKEYILWLDADDILLPKDQDALRALKKTLDTSVDVVMMKYAIAFDASGNPTFTYYRERLSKREKGFFWREPVHEYLVVGGKIIQSDIVITHAKPPTRAEKKSDQVGRNLRIYESNLAQGQQLSIRGMYYYARELKDHKRYTEAVEAFSKFLDKEQGWIEDRISACTGLAQSYFALKQEEDGLKALFNSFLLDNPRAEICCEIGYAFKRKKQWNLAAFWFELVFSLKKPEQGWGFIQEDYWGYIPALECCLCYEKLGDLQKAKVYNEKAGEYKPDSAAVEHNRKYFATKSI